MRPRSTTRLLALARFLAGANGFAPSSSPALFGSPGPAEATAALATTALASSPAGMDSAFVDISDEARREVSWMERWAANGGVQRAEGFEIGAHETNDRGLSLGRGFRASTRVDLAAGSPVLFVPEAMILSGSKAIEELRGVGMEEAEALLAADRDPEDPPDYRRWYLALKILREVDLGKDSLYFPWLDSLPRKYSNAASMTDFCLQCLPPLMKRLAAEEREGQRRLRSSEALAAVPFLSDEIKSHPSDYMRWACQVVATRSVETDDGDVQIVPVADFFDHGSGDVEEVQSYHDEAGNYCAYTAVDVPAGSKLVRRYADPRNPSHLLARYGFVDEDCPATHCKLLPEDVSEEMLELGYSHDRMLFYRTGEVADEVWDIFLYQHLSSADVTDQQELMRAHRFGDHAAKLALHEKHYGATSAALLHHVDSFLDDVDRVIRKAETIGVNDPDSVYIKYEHPRLPLIHRHNLFVRETFQNVRNRYSSDPDVNWREATRVTVQECDDAECAIAECDVDFNGNWSCEGGLGLNWDGSERETTKTVIAAQ